MTNKRAIEIIENERCCVIRQSGPGIVCDRNCARCELVLPDQEVLDAYDKAIAALENLEDCRNELCLKCGDYKMRHKGACDGCRWRDGNDKVCKNLTDGDVDRWISVEERKPKPFQKVLIYWTDSGGPMEDTAFWQEEVKRFDAQHWTGMEDKITHWRPLPAPPVKIGRIDDGQ